MSHAIGPGDRGDAPRDAIASEPVGLRILVLNANLPIFPGAGGYEFLTLTTLASLAADVGLVSMAHTREELNRSSALAAGGVRLYLWESAWLDGAPASTHAKGVRIAHGWLQEFVAWVRARPGQPVDTRIMEGAFSNMAPGVIQALRERPWHVLVVVQSSAATMIDALPRPLVSVLVMHDIRARMYERQALVAGSFRERRRLAREARRYHRFERRYCQRFDLVVTVSDEDARWVSEHYGPRRVLSVPLTVDTEHFAPRPAEEECDGRIIFTGLMSHPPNVDAACFFAREVLPGIRTTIAAAEFHIVGRDPLPSVRALAELPGVRVFANVPDMRTHIAAASVVVVPLRFGSGARSKILEAWSMEKCVVTTTIGAEGLEFEDGTNAIVADGAPALARAVTTALRERGVRDRVRRSGRVVAQTRHDPLPIYSAYHDELVNAARRNAAADSAMRVLLDLRWMIPGRAGGLEHLAHAFLKQLARLDIENEFTAIVPAAARHDLDIGHSSKLRMVSPDSVSALLAKSGKRLTSRMLAALRVPQWRTGPVEHVRSLRRLDAQIAYSFPGYIHAELDGLRHVLLVPDIQHEYFPQFFSGQALDERQRQYTASARRADHICAISEFTRRTLIEKLAIPPDRITTVLLAADAIFTPRAVRPDEDRRVLASLGLERHGYVFFPAHTWLHKNHRAAIEALRMLRARGHEVPPLVCTGEPREAQPELDVQVRAAGLDRHVRFLGYRRREEIPALYRGAKCVVFPSLFEGFGMPVLEAMASGCPVVCSNTTSLPEIAGDAALLVDPQDPGAIADALLQVLTEPEVGRELVARGLQRAATFSWQRHTIETVAVLRRVHERLLAV